VQGLSGGTIHTWGQEGFASQSLEPRLQVQGLSGGTIHTWGQEGFASQSLEPRLQVQGLSGGTDHSWEGLTSQARVLGLPPGCRQRSEADQR